jgi:uncharacterized membrane protein YedE/YeeE
MDFLREAAQANPAGVLAVGGLIIGLMFGYVVFRTNFCTMGAVSDLVTFGDSRRFRAWVLAATTAMVGTQMLAVAGIVPIEKSMYLAPTLNWAGNLLGGGMFGYGMVFAGGCASRNLARAGGGDLRALLTLLVLGVFAYMAIGGLFGPLRSALEQATSISLSGLNASTQGLGDVAGRLAGVGPATATAVAAFALSLAGIGYAFKDEGFRTSPAHVASGVLVGLCVVAGWAVTGLAYDELAVRPVAPISLTFVRPAADTVDWLERFTAGMVPGFGVATVLGALVGAFAAAVAMGRFRLTTFSSVGDTRRVLFGAVLMGAGGVMAGGCTVGQGITGVATLAVGSYLTVAAIVAGAIVGLRHLEAAIADEV